MENKPMNGQSYDLTGKSGAVVLVMRNPFLTLLLWSLGFMVMWFWTSFFLTFGMRGKDG